MKRERQPARCWCGHDREAHTHYRSGTDCALCTCQRWAPPRWWRLRLFRLGRESLLDRVNSRLPGLAATGRAEYLPAATAMSVNLGPGRCVPLVREVGATWVMKEASRNPVSGHEPLMRVQLSLACTGRGGPSPSRRIRTCRAPSTRSAPGPTLVPARVRPASGSPSRGPIRSAGRSRRRAQRPPRLRTTGRRPAARSAGGIPTAALPTTGIQPGRARTTPHPVTPHRQRRARGCRAGSSPPPGPRRLGSSHPASRPPASSQPASSHPEHSHPGRSRPGSSRSANSRPRGRCFASSLTAGSSFGSSLTASSRFGSSHPGRSRPGSSRLASRHPVSSQPRSRRPGRSRVGGSRLRSWRGGHSRRGSGPRVSSQRRGTPASGIPRTSRSGRTGP